MISETGSQSTLRDPRPERPKAVLHAIVGMWASVLIGQGVNVFQALYGPDGLDMGAVIFSCVMLVAALVVQWQMSTQREWTRMAYLLLLVLSYSLMALDDAGFTRLDMASLVLTIPINLYVLSALYGEHASLWFLGPDSNVL